MMKRWGALVAAVVFLASVPSPTLAAFPGVNGKFAYGDQDGLFLVSANGQFKETFSDDFRVNHPEFSPDGSRLAVVVGKSIRTYRLDGTDERILFSSPASNDDIYFSPTWSPDGSRVAFGLDSFDAALNGTWIVNADGTGAERVFEGDLSDIEWSPTADVFVYESNGIVTVPIGSFDFTVVSSDRSAYNPSWSPDGTEILYTADGPEFGLNEVVRVNADGSNQRIITDEGGAAAWSPDGKKVAYSRSYPAFNTFGLFIVDLATGQTVETAAQTGPIFHLDWGPCAAGTDCNAAPPPPPAPTPQEQARTVTLTLSSHILAVGEVRGDDSAGFDCEAHTPVKLQKRKSGRWRTVTTVPSNPAGGYDAGLPDRPGVYRAKLPRTSSPDGLEICLGARSEVRKHTH